MEKEEHCDLGDILPSDLFNHPDCCNSRSYWIWERDVAAPALRAMGYQISHWSDEERDSFGPLIRSIRLTKDGETKTYTYG